jgi:hypothetical protein
MNSERGSEIPYNLSKYVSTALPWAGGNRGRAHTTIPITNDVQNEIRGSRTIIR